jgi:hypothetical protein
MPESLSIQPDPDNHHSVYRSLAVGMPRRPGAWAFTKIPRSLRLRFHRILGERDGHRDGRRRSQSQRPSPESGALIRQRWGTDIIVAAHTRFRALQSCMAGGNLVGSGASRVQRQGWCFVRLSGAHVVRRAQVSPGTPPPYGGCRGRVASSSRRDSRRDGVCLVRCVCGD